MFDTNPHPQKPKHTPPPSPLQKVKTPFLRTGGPVSFRARSTFRATILILTLVIVVTVANELRCVSEGCLTRVGFRESNWVGGGSVIPESIRNQLNNVVEYIDGDDGRKEGEGEPIKDLDKGWEYEGMDAGFSGESALVDPAEGFAGGEGKEAGSGRWIDETQGRTLGEEIRVKKPAFLTIPDAFPIVKVDYVKEKTVEEIVDGIQKTAIRGENKWKGIS
jgi:hypothetical protein